MKLSDFRATNTFLLLAAVLAILSVWSSGLVRKIQAQGANVTRSAFGQTPDGKAVDLFTLTNASGLQARIMTYGATLVSLHVPDRSGKLEDIVLGYDRLEDYLKNSPYFGSTVGRYANRIARGTFSLDGQKYQLATNNAPNHLHGGVKGFDKVVWNAESSVVQEGARVVLSYRSADGEEGYPGALDVRVTYVLRNSNELSVEYFATTDKTTIVNLSHHSYFNLSSGTVCPVLDHELTIHADRYTPIDPTSIPTGLLASVAGTPFDFRKPVRLGAFIDQEHEQLRNGRGYDHNYVLNRGGEGLILAARVTDPASGRVMELSTTEPGLQFYSGNFLSGMRGKNGRVYERRCGFCLEPQHYPDSPNRPEFPSTVLRPGQTYQSRTVFAFKTQ